MSRRNKAVKRPVPPDPRYDSQTVSKFVSNLMYQGKKSTAEQIFYSAMDLIEERTGQPGVTVFKQAVNNAKPALEVKSRRVGGASLQVPVEVRPERRTALAMRWIIEYSRARTEKSMEERLAAELILASKGEGQHHQEEGRHPPDGRGQPGVRALSVVEAAGGTNRAVGAVEGTEEAGEIRPLLFSGGVGYKRVSPRPPCPSPP